MTLIPDQTDGAARRRADLITGLRDLTAFLVSHPDTPLRRFGPILAEGHLSPEDRPATAHRAAKGRRASVSITGSGATA